LRKVNEPAIEVKIPSKRIPVNLKKEVTKKNLDDSGLKGGESEN